MWALVKWLLIASTAIIVGLIVAAIIFRIPLLEAAGSYWLSAKGIAPVHLRIAAFTLDELRLGRTRIGEELEVDSVVAQYSLSGLLNGEIAGLSVSGLRAHARLDGTRINNDVALKLGLLEESSDDAGSPPPWPLDKWQFRKLGRAVLSNVELHVSSEYGPLRLDVISGEGQFENGQVQAAASARLLYGESDLAFSVTAKIPKNGQAALDVAMAGGRIEEPRVRLTVDSGIIAVALDGAPIPALDGTLRVREVKIDDVEIDELTLTGARSDEGGIDAKVALRSGSAILDLGLSAAAPLDDAGEINLDGSAAIRDLGALYQRLPETLRSAIRNTLTPEPVPEAGRLWMAFGGLMPIAALRRAMAVKDGSLPISALDGSAASLLVSVEDLAFADPAQETPAAANGTARINFDADMALEVVEKQILVDWQNPIRLTADTLPWPWIPPDLHADLRRIPQLRGPLAITIAPAERSLALGLTPPALGEGAIDISVEAGDAAWLNAKITARVLEDEVQSGTPLIRAELAADLAATRYQDSRVAVRGLTLAGNIAADRLDLSVTGGVDLRQRLTDASINTTLGVDGRVIWRNGEWTYSAVNCQNLSHGRLQTAGVAVGRGRWQLCPLQSNQVLVRVDPEQNLNIATNVRLTRELQITQVPEDAAAPRTIKLAPMGAAVTGSVNGERQSWDMAVRAQTLNAALDNPNYAVAVQPFTLSGRGRGADIANLQSDLTGRVADNAIPANLAPLQFRSALAVKANQVDASLDLSDQEGNQIVTAQVSHDLARGRGSGQVNTPELVFSPATYQPQDWLLFLKAKVTDVVGSLQLQSTAAWSPSGIESSEARVRLANIGLETPFAIMGGLNGNLTFSKLFPLQTASRQRLDLDSLDVGLVLPNGRFEFELPGNDRVFVHEAAWPFAGGRLAIEEVDAKFQADKRALTMVAENIDLQKLLTDLDIEGLSGTGLLSGRLPIIIQHDVAIVRKGKLTAGAEGGILRYVDETTTSALSERHEGGAILTKALEDFHYRRLEMEIDGVTSGRIDVDFHLEGANPALYDGYPVALNLSLSGALAEIAQQGLAGLTLSDKLRQQLQGQ